MLTANHSEVRKSIYTGVWNTPILEPSSTEFRLYNLTTGKLVIKYDTRDYNRNNSSKPRIIFAADYMTYDNDVYEIKNDGNLERTAMTVEELMAKVIQEINLQRREIDFHYADELVFNDPYFWYFDRLDINALFKNIPDNLALRWTGSNDWRFKEDGKSAYYFKPIYRNTTHPLKDGRLLYQVEFTTSKNGERYTGRSPASDVYTGLYDAVENK